MPAAELYRRQAELLVRTLPLVAVETCFALKGGTAINLFVRDMPRLSLIAAIVGNMPADHRRFLITVKRGEPEWALLELPGADALPAVRWRLENLARLDRMKRAAFLSRLGEVLGVAE